MGNFNKDKMLSAMNKLKETREGEYLTLEGKIEKLTSEKESLLNENEKLKNQTVLTKFENLITENNLPHHIDEIETQIKTLKEDLTRCGWLIGQRLDYIHENKLYKHKYETFFDYCLNELEIVKQTAYNLMFVYKSFNLEDTIKFGSKLYLLQKIKNPKDRDNLKSWMDENNPSYRQVEEKIKSLASQPVVIDAPIAELPQPIFKGRKKITIEYASIIPVEKQDEFYIRLEALLKEFTVM